MIRISMLVRIVITLACPTAGLAGCMPDATVRIPDVEDCPHRDYRVRAVELPSSALGSIEIAFDLDGDGVRDNWLGFAAALVHAWTDAFDVGPVLDRRLRHALDWRLVLYECDSGSAAAALVPGDDPDLGAAVLPASGDRPPLTGGTLAVPLGALGDALGTAPPGWTLASLAHVRIEDVDDRAVTATIGLAVDHADVLRLVAPALAAFFTTRLATGDSDFALTADTDGDRTISTAELLASPTAQALLAPDLDDAASLGFRIHAER
jgi:hypothetical protein